MASMTAALDVRFSLQTTFVLFESASGYALLEVKEFDEISQAADKVQEAVRYAGGCAGVFGRPMRGGPAGCRRAEGQGQLHGSGEPVARPAR